ncbi:hypothetical protein IWW51_000560 [Coemansia sp. RSA 2702]|nr:hypothetical protein IWW52_002216 [Coemansia sp. RSA 2704]KAJ2329519.1 hypothetical protein IWW51_000560 [Coemansia sp. RSA 2702]KAJ2366454.1 hypothetical protein H4S01_002702 [Coemansia sp. RSA 2610]
MAPGRPSPVHRATNGHSNGNGYATNGQQQRRRRRLNQQQQQPTEIKGLPEYLYDAHAQLAYTGAYGHALPLLIDASNGDQITCRRFRRHALVLARNLEMQCGVAAGDTIAILAHSNIDIPIITIAAWSARASIVVLPADASQGELQAMLLRHLPRVLFVSETLLEQARLLLAGISNAESVQAVAFDFDNHIDEELPERLRQLSVSWDRTIWSIRDLYSSDSDRLPAEPQPLSLNEAQELTAIIYFTHHMGEDGSVTVDATDMSHYSVVSFYTSSLRRSPSLPGISSSSRQPTADSNRPQTPMSRPNMPRAAESTIAAPANTPDIAYTVLRMHRAYRLHRVLFDMFCRGARYVVARSFHPADFAARVSQYRLKYAELTYAETSQLIEYLQSYLVRRASSESEAELQSSAYAISSTSSLDSGLADMLASLRCIYVESARATTELGPELTRLLPDAIILRTRFGSYVDPPVR